MITPFSRNKLGSRIIAFVIIFNFIFSSAPLRSYANAVNTDKLKIRSTTKSHAPDRTKLIEDIKEAGAKTNKDGGSSYVLTYDNPKSEDPRTAGGKCAKLAWAYRRGIPTPLGFNITVDAVREYYRHNPELIEMIKGIHNLDVTNAQERKAASERMQKFMLEKTHLPPEVLDAIKRHIIEISIKLGYPAGKYVKLAYRGSGTIEDFEGKIPWFDTSIGAQPGQGTTVLNKEGLDVAEESVIEVIAGLFNDQIFVYRDIQIFFDFVKQMKDKPEYRKLIRLAEKYGHKKAADRLRNEKSPGYVNLQKVLKDIAENEPDTEKKYGWREKLEKSANDILEPMNFVTGIAVLEMVESYISGTAFTSHPGTAFDGSTYAKQTSKFPSKPGDNFEGYTRYVKINYGLGLGPGIVEGKFQPNIVTLFDTTGKGNWVPMEFKVGKKEMRLVYLDKAMEAIKHKYTAKQIKRLAALYADWQVSGKQYDVFTASKSEFNIADAEVWVRAMMDLWFYFDKPEKYRCKAEEKQGLLKQLDLTEDEFFILSYLVKHINKVATGYDTASYILNTPEMSTSRLLSEDALHKLADVIAEVGNINAKERLEAGDKEWRERRDVEFAIAICKEDDPSPYKVKLEHIYDRVTGKDLGPGWVKVVHLQNRPINPEKEVQDPDNLIFKRKKVDKDFIEEHRIEPVADKGLVGYGAAEGQLYIVDPYRSLSEQEEEVKALREKGIPVIAVLEEMGPEHDPIVEAAGAGIVWRGNDTSHAYIFSLEQRIPIAIGPYVNAEFAGYIQHGKGVVISGEDGEIWPGDKGIPLVDDDLIIRIDMRPDTKAGIIVSTLQSAQQIARLGTRSVLTRIEFLINQVVKIYPQAGYAYDLMVALDKGEKAEAQLTREELKDIEILKKDPKTIQRIKETIVGFPSACEFIAEQMRYVSNAMGAVFPEGNKMRAYDNKEKEALLYGLIGANLFLRYDDSMPEFDSPLTSMRGSQLMIHPHLKKGFLSLNRGIVRSIKDGFRNNSFFFVYLRDLQELKIQLQDFDTICREEGAYPREIGVMIELGNNIWFIDEIMDVLIDFLEEHRNDGVEEVFISFGTNDLTHALGLKSREDRDFSGDVKILHPALINVEPEIGRIEIEPGVSFGPKEKGKPFIIKTNDESAPIVMRVVEHIVSRVRAKKGKSSLCGQLVTLSINRGKIKVGMRTISALDSYGTQSNKLIAADMMDFDAQTNSIQLSDENVLAANSPIAELSEIKDEIKEAIVTGEVVFISKPEDILKLREGKNKQKIAIIRNSGTREELENAGIPWDYLRYAGAILIDEEFKGDLGILKEDAWVKQRIKARIKMTETVNDGEFITLIYNKGSAYKGKLPTITVERPLAEIRMPAEGLVPASRNILRISAGDLFKRHRLGKPAIIDIHPLAFTLYKEKPELLSADVREAVKQLIGDKDPLEYLESRFTEHLLQKTQEAQEQGLTPVYTVFRLTRNQLRLLKGGEAIEKTKGKEGGNFDDPRNRLQGGDRGLSDFWQIYNLELNAFKQAKSAFPSLGLQLSVTGTRSQEMLEGQLRVLRTFGITADNQEIGLELVTPADVLLVEDYIRQGIKFFSYDDEELAQNLLSANLRHPEMFKIEGKLAITRWQLGRPVKYVRGIIAENKDKGAWLGVTPKQFIRKASAEVYDSLPKDQKDQYNNFLSLLKDTNLLLVFGANVIFENGETIAALNRVKEIANGKVITAAWTDNDSEVDKLLNTGIEAVMDIVTFEGLGDALAKAKKLDENIKNTKIVLINSPKDLENIRKEYNLQDISQFKELVAEQFVNDKTGIKLINLKTPNAKEGKRNDMLLTIDNAITTATGQREGEIIDSYRALSTLSIKNLPPEEVDTKEAIMRLDEFSLTVVDMPLVPVTKEVSEKQQKYEIALKAVGISG